MATRESNDGSGGNQYQMDYDRCGKAHGDDAMGGRDRQGLLGPVWPGDQRQQLHGDRHRQPEDLLLS